MVIGPWSFVSVETQLVLRRPSGGEHRVDGADIDRRQPFADRAFGQLGHAKQVELLHDLGVIPLMFA